jgi:hypothetical protein
VVYKRDIAPFRYGPVSQIAAAKKILRMGRFRHFWKLDTTGFCNVRRDNSSAMF